MSAQQIAVIPGDGNGIGGEVITSARAVLDAAASKHGISLGYTEFDWSCQRYAEVGAMMPDDGLDTLREFDAILLGAVGWPGVADHVSLWGLLIPIRRAFLQYVNLRPIRLFPGVAGPLRTDADIDFVVVRENVEGEYSEIGGRLKRGFPDEMAVQESVFTRVGVSRIAEGSIGIAPSANLDPTKQSPSMFEPVHGSAPDIAGRGIANTIGAVWSAALMLSHLGHAAAADDVIAAMESALAEPRTRTRDLGGTASTEQVTAALVTHLG